MPKSLRTYIADLHREHEAGAHRRAVHQHGAGAADAVLAADVGAREPEVLAQEVAEEPARLHEPVALHAVHGERDRVLLRADRWLHVRSLALSYQHISHQLSLLSRWLALC